MDYIASIKGVNYFEIGRDFNYIQATKDFLGLKLFPMVKTEELKVAIQQLVDGGELPVIALVHAFDTEARIGDRPNFEEFRAELFLIKEKLNQGEALRKRLKDSGMTPSEANFINSIFDDASNLISRIITALEAKACELLSTGRIVVSENNVSRTVDQNIPAENRIIVSGWDTASHDIIGDLLAIKAKSNNEIVRGYTSNKILRYMLKNTAIINIATKVGAILTLEWLKKYLAEFIGIEFVTYENKYKLNAQDGKSTAKRFTDEDAISFVTTDGVLGRTFMTSTPAEDYGKVQKTTAFCTVHSVEEGDPVGIWTIGSGVGLPVLANKNGLYIVKVGA